MAFKAADLMAGYVEPVCVTIVFITSDIGRIHTVNQGGFIGRKWGSRVIIMAAEAPFLLAVLERAISFINAIFPVVLGAKRH